MRVIVLAPGTTKTARRTLITHEQCRFHRCVGSPRTASSSAEEVAAVLGYGLTARNLLGINEILLHPTGHTGRRVRER